MKWDDVVAFAALFVMLAVWMASISAFPIVLFLFWLRSVIKDWLVDSITKVSKW